MPNLLYIYGQDKAISTIQRAIETNRLAHAYLFIGPEGSGKATTALAIAGALNCLEAPGQGCDTCSSCIKVQHGIHPDVHILGTRTSHLLVEQAKHLQALGMENVSEPTNASILIEQVRELESRLDLPPHEGRYRVVIIDGADLLGESSANALLKSLEEPRDKTIFILVSSNAHRLLPTIISRCQRLRFAPLKSEHLQQIATSFGAFTPQQCLTAIKLAEGNAQRLRQMLEGQRIEKLKQTADKILAISDRPSAKAMFGLSSEQGKEREDFLDMLHLLRLQLRDQMLDVEARVETVSLAMRRLRAIEEATNAMRGNVQLALVMENLILGMRQVIN